MNDEMAQAICNGEMVVIQSGASSPEEEEMLITIAEAILGLELAWGTWGDEPGWIYIQRLDVFQANHSPA